MARNRLLVRRASIMAIALVVVAELMPLRNARADTHIVTNDHDSGTGSLREAIATVAPGDTITFEGDYVIQVASQLVISSSLTIDGSGHTITLDGNDASSVISVSANSHVTLSQLRIVNGASSPGGGDTGTPYGRGAGILNAGTVTVTNSLISNNAAEQGGAIFNQGTLTVQSSVLADNRAAASGYDESGQGGALYNAGDATIADCTFSDNTGDWGGGALYNATTGVFTATGSSLLLNHSAAGGGLFNRGHATVESSSFLENSAGASSHGFGGGAGIYNDGTLAVSNSTLSGNTSQGSALFGPIGSGLANNGYVTIANSTFADNRFPPNPPYPAQGADVYNGNLNGMAIVTNTVLASNIVGGNCGGKAFEAASTHNLSTDSSCVGGVTRVTLEQLSLGPLTGTPAYFPIAFGSVAVDSGTNVGCPLQDQAGNSRPQDGNDDGIAICDVGAYEAPHISLFKIYFPIIVNAALVSLHSRSFP